MSDHKQQPTYRPTDEDAFEPDPEYRADYFGTGTLYLDIARENAGLHELTGLDRDKWSIVGLDISPAGGRSYQSDTVRVLAVDREALPPDMQKPGGLVGADEIHVVDFLCHDLTLRDVLDCMAEVHLFFKSKSLIDSKFHLVGRGDIPEQPDS